MDASRNGVAPDLSSLDTQTPAELGTVVELDNPFTGEPITNEDGSPWSITVRGEDSATVRAVIVKQRNKFTERLRKRGQFGDADSADAEATEKLVAATITWAGLVMDGKPYEYSPQNAQRLYSDRRFAWIVEQLQSATVDRKRFFSMPSAS